jgi:sec-independent protein translocase protein TatA
MPNIGVTELLIIMVIALIIFGGGKLAGVGKALGQAISEFRSAVKGEEEKPTEPPNSTQPHA